MAHSDSDPTANVYSYPTRSGSNSKSDHTEHKVYNTIYGDDDVVYHSPALPSDSPTSSQIHPGSAREYTYPAATTKLKSDNEHKFYNTIYGDDVVDNVYAPGNSETTVNSSELPSYDIPFSHSHHQ